VQLSCNPINSRVLPLPLPLPLGNCNLFVICYFVVQVSSRQSAVACLSLTLFLLLLSARNANYKISAVAQSMLHSRMAYIIYIYVHHTYSPSFGRWHGVYLAACLSLYLCISICGTWVIANTHMTLDNVAGGFWRWLLPKVVRGVGFLVLVVRFLEVVLVLCFSCVWMLIDLGVLETKLLYCCWNCWCIKFIFVFCVIKIVNYFPNFVPLIALYVMYWLTVMDVNVLKTYEL